MRSQGDALHLIFLFLPTTRVRIAVQEHTGAKIGELTAVAASMRSAIEAAAKAAGAARAAASVASDKENASKSTPAASTCSGVGAGAGAGASARQELAALAALMG